MLGRAVLAGAALLLPALAAAQNNALCRKARDIDVIFAIDVSGSIGDLLPSELTFVRQMTKSLSDTYTDQGIWYGAVSFGPLRIIAPLSNYTAPDFMRKIVPDNVPLGGDTPTHDAITSAQNQFATLGRTGVSHLLVIITDGEPNGVGNCIPLKPNDCFAPDLTRKAATLAKDSGISIVTVGVKLKDYIDFQNSNIQDMTTRQYMTELASAPNYAFPTVDNFDNVTELVASIIDKACFYVTGIAPPYGPNNTDVLVIGYNLFNTKHLKCKFDWGQFGSIVIPAKYYNDSSINCPAFVPDRTPACTTALVEVSTDGVGFSGDKRTFTFQPAGSDCFAAAAGSEFAHWMWIVPLALVLVGGLILFALLKRPKPAKKAPAPQQYTPAAVTAPLEEPKVTVHMPEEHAAPPPPPIKKDGTKWQVVSSAYIGYGKGKMDVNWAGDAPESAPHEMKRQKVADVPAKPKRDQIDVAQETPYKGSEAVSLTTQQPVHAAEPEQEPGCFAKMCSCFAAKKARTAQPASVQLTQPAKHVPIGVVHGGAYDTLPAGWEAIVMDDGQVYYENRDLQITQWHRPV